MPKTRAIAAVATIVRKGEEQKAHVYWRTRPMAERLAALESTRAEFHGYTDATQPRLERVCRVAQR